MQEEFCINSVRPISLSDPPFISDDLLVRYIGASMQKTVGKCILVSLPDCQQKVVISLLKAVHQRKLRSFLSAFNILALDSQSTHS